MKKLVLSAALMCFGTFAFSTNYDFKSDVIEILPVNEISENNKVEILPSKLKSPGDVIISFDLSCCTGATWSIKSGTTMTMKQLRLIEAVLESVYCD